MAGLPPSEFAARLAGIRDYLKGRAGGESLASVAAEGLIDGMENIATAAVKRLKERTPRSSEDHAHIADGWTFRRVDTPGVVTFEVVNTDPRATEPMTLADGRVTDYTLLEILEYGSDPHDIVPVNAEFLAFMGGGGDMVYTKHVDHPGTRPYAMVSTTATEVALDVKKLIDATRRTLTLKQMGKL